MKTIKLFLVAALIFAGINMQAQHRGMQGKKGMQGPKFEQIMEKKMIFFKENLMLTPQESKSFETAYKKYMQEKMKIHKSLQTEFRSKIEKGNYLNLSDSELNRLLDRKMALESQKVKIELNFQKELRRILPPKKLIKFYKSERSFNRKLMARMKKGRKMQKRTKQQLPKNK